MNARLALFAALLALAAPAAAQERVITTPELLKRMSGPADRWTFTLVDARTAVEFGEAHIPGSVNVAASKTAKRLPEIVKDKARAVVFYCNGPNCTKTVKAAKAATAAGYTDVWEYKEGLPGWGKAGQKVDGKPLPLHEAAPLTPEALKGLLAGSNPPVVVDIRDAEEFEGFHIEKALSLPIDDLQARLKEIPAGRLVVVADHAGHQAPVAARLLASLGRKDLKRLDGGVIKWQASGLPTTKGK
jgi:rhodanese-related sulfurtransferase